MSYEYKRLAMTIYNDVYDEHLFVFAAGLSYYFVLSLFPLLILIAQCCSPLLKLQRKTGRCRDAFCLPDRDHLQVSREAGATGGLALYQMRQKQSVPICET